MLGSFKKDQNKIRSFKWYRYVNDIDMVEKDITAGICQSTYWYAKASKEHKKDYDKNKESSYLQYCDVNNFCGWATPQKLPENNFECVKDTSHSNEYFLKNYNEESNEEHFLEVDVQYLEKLHELHNNLAFLLERIIIEKS